MSRLHVILIFMLAAGAAFAADPVDIAGGESAGGGGMTVGNAVSGGTHPCVLFTDASGLLACSTAQFQFATDGSTYNTLVIEGPDATSAANMVLSRSADTESAALLFWTGFPGAASAGNPVYGLQHRTDETFWIKRNDGSSDYAMLSFATTGNATFSNALTVTGATLLSSTLRVDGAADFRAAISNGGSASCAAGGTGAVCVDDTLGVTGQGVFTRDPASTSSSDAAVLIAPATSAANEQLLTVRDNTTAIFSVDKEGDVGIAGAISNGSSNECSSGAAGAVCVNDSFVVSYAAAGTSLRQGFHSVHLAAGRGGVSFGYNDADVVDQAISSDSDDLNVWGDADSDFIFQPGNSTSVTFEDFGEVRIHRNATGGVTGTDCDADAEVGRIRRYSKDANNITLCVCQKVGSAFGWAAMGAGGDCT